jgi:chloride channel 3/4/5
VLEVALVTAVVAALQFVNPGTRARYDVIIRTLLVDCSSSSSSSNNAATDSWVCANEGDGHAQGSPLAYRLWLLYGSLVVLATTTITAGIKLPSGIIMPALSGGALFGRLVAQFFSNGASSSTSSSMGGVFAMVGASAFLAGVTRMTISLCVVMFELTGELEAVVPHMVAILCAKWVADAISRDSIYDLTQSALGHPFLSPDEAMWEVAQAESEERAADRLIPPLRTMRELTVVVPADNKVARKLLQGKLDMLKRRGLMDSGLVLVQGNDVIQGYIPQHELEFGLNELGASFPREADVRLLGSAISDDELDLSRFVNRAPVCICASAPVEVVVALFTHLGVRYICLTEEGTGALVGVVIRKRLMGYLDGLKNHH